MFNGGSFYFFFRGTKLRFHSCEIPGYVNGAHNTPRDFRTRWANGGRTLDNIDLETRKKYKFNKLCT